MGSDLRKIRCLGGGLNENGRCGLICLNAWSSVRGTVFLLEECVTEIWDFKKSMPPPPFSLSLSLPPVDQDVSFQLLLQHHAWLLPCILTWHAWTPSSSETISKPPIKCLGCRVSSQPETSDSAFGPQCYVCRRAKRGQAVCSWSPVRSHCPVSVVLNHGCSGAATGFYLPGNSQQTPIKGCGEFLVKNPWKCRYNIQTYSVTTDWLSPSCFFLCLPLSPFFFLASFFKTYVFIGIQTMSNPNSVFLFYFSCLCVWCAHMYMCMHMHVHACVCECMCVHVYTCRVQKLTPDVFLMYPPSYSCRRLSCSNPEHIHTALTSLASQRSRARLSLSLVWVLAGSSFSLYACMVGVFEGWAFSPASFHFKTDFTTSSGWLQVTILLPHPPECRDYRCVPAHLA